MSDNRLILGRGGFQRTSLTVVYSCAGKTNRGDA